jgi:heme exporter protein B
MSLARTVWLILRKDILTELRTREVVATMGLFSLLLVVVFAFAFPVDLRSARVVAPGVLWVVVLFSGTLGLGRVFDREREAGCFTALILAPGGAVAVYVAKVLGVFLFTVVVEVITLPVALLFLGISVPADGLGLLVFALFLGTVGFSLIGTLFAGMLASAHLREVLVPVVVYPVVVPVIIAGVELTSIALGHGLPMETSRWVNLMIGFDLLFLAISPWVFGRVMLE